MFDLDLPHEADDVPAPCQTPPLSPPCQRILLEQLRAAAAAQPASEFDPEALLTAALGAVDEQQRKPATVAGVAGVALRTCPPLTPLASRRRVSALVITTPTPQSASYGNTDDLSPAHAPPSPSDSGASASPQSEYSAMFRSASPTEESGSSASSSGGHGFKRVSGLRARRSDEGARAEPAQSAPAPTFVAEHAAPSPSTTPKPTPRHQPRSTGSISRPPGGNFVLGAKAALGLLRKRGSQRSTTL